MDRLAAAVAANRLHQNCPAVVVDAGTAITVDSVAVDGVFQGGIIMPGMRMMLRSLATGTDLLPLIEAGFSDAIPDVIGRSTEDAIRSGVFWARWAVFGTSSCACSRRPGKGKFSLPEETLPDWPNCLTVAVCVPHMVLAGVLWSEP